MTELFIDDTPNLVIDSATTTDGLSQDRVEYESTMQELANIPLTNNYQGLRDSLAEAQITEDRDTDMTFTEAALRSRKMSPEQAAALMKYEYKSLPGISLEREAGTVQTATALQENPDQAQIAYADRDGMIEDFTRKRTATLGLIQNLREYSSKAQGFFGDALDFARVAIDPGFHQLGVAAGYSKTLTGTGKKLSKTSLGLAEDIRKRLFTMQHTMSAAEYEEAIDKIFQEITAANPNTWILDDLIDAIEGGNTLTDTMGVIDLIGLGAAVKGAVVKGVNKVGMKKAAADAIRVGKSVEKLSTSLPTGFKPVSQKASTSAYGVGKEAISEELVHMATKDMVFDGLEEAEKAGIIDEVRKNVDKVFGLAKDEPVDYAIEESTDGIVNVVARVGGADGQGMSLKQAVARQKELAEKGFDVSVVRDDATGSYLEMRHTVDGNITDAFIENVNGIDDFGVKDGYLAGLRAWANRHLAGSTNLSKVAHAKNIEAERVQQALYNKYYKTKKALWDSLDEQQQKTVDAAATEGKNMGRWLSDEELASRSVNDVGKEAYRAYQNMEDITYIMDNILKVRQLNKEGVRQYAGKYLGKEVPSVAIDYNKAAIVNAEGMLMDKTQLLEHADRYTFIKLKEGFNNVNVTHLALPKGSAVAEDLPLFVTPYLAGGRRQYLKGTYFVRAMGNVKDETGKTVAKRVRVLTTARTAEDAAKCTEEIQQVINILKEVGDNALEGAERLSHLNLKYFRVNNWDQVTEMVKAGVLDADSQVKYMTHGKRFIPDSTEVLENIDDMSMDLLKTRELFNRHRGNLLDDVFGNDALTYSLDEMYNKAISRAAALGARGDLMAWYKKSLMPYIDRGMFKDSERLRNLDPERMIKEAVLVDRKTIAEVDMPRYRAAENLTLLAKRMTNAKTPGDIAMNRFMSSVAEHIYPAASKLIKNPEQVSKIMTKVESFNPSKFAQGLAFQAYMGWWNPVQLYKQMMGTANILFLEPVRGVQAVCIYPLVRLARATENLSTVKKTYLAAIKKITGIDDNAVDGLMKYMDRFGTEFSSGLFVGAEDYSKALLRDKTGLFNKFWQSQYFFMKEGNAANYYVADIAAYLARHNKGNRAVAAYADDLFLNMTKASASDIQTGVTSLFTQWLTYPMRTIEALGNNRLTKAQRIGLLLGNIGLYGVGGTAGLNLYNSLTDSGLSPEASNMIATGLMGSLGKELDVNLDEGIGAFNMLQNVLGVYNMETGEFQLPPISAGSGLAIFGNTLTYLTKLAAFPASDRSFTDFCQQVAQEKFLPSTFKNGAKALIAFRYGKLINSRGVISENPTMTQKVFQALGFQPYEAKAVREMRTAIMDQDKTVQDCVDTLKPYIEAVNKYQSYNIETDDAFHRLVKDEDRMTAELEASLIDEFGADSSVVKDFRKKVSKLRFGGMRYLVDESLAKGSKKLSTGRFEAARYLYPQEIH